jgi:hypothetical protein
MVTSDPAVSPFGVTLVICAQHGNPHKTANIAAPIKYRVIAVTSFCRVHQKYRGILRVGIARYRNHASIACPDALR